MKVFSSCIAMLVFGMNVVQGGINIQKPDWKKVCHDYKTIGYLISTQSDCDELKRAPILGVTTLCEKCHIYDANEYIYCWDVSC